MKETIVYMQSDSPLDVYGEYLPQYIGIAVGRRLATSMRRLVKVVRQHQLSEARDYLDLKVVGNALVTDNVMVNEVRIEVDKAALFCIVGKEKYSSAPFTTRLTRVEQFLTDVESGVRFFGDDGFEAYVKERLEINAKETAA